MAKILAFIQYVHDIWPIEGADHKRRHRHSPADACMLADGGSEPLHEGD